MQSTRLKIKIIAICHSFLILRIDLFIFMLISASFGGWYLIRLFWPFLSHIGVMAILASRESFSVTLITCFLILSGMIWAGAMTMLPCTLDRILHATSFNTYHPITHHPLVWLALMMWDQVYWEPRLLASWKVLLAKPSVARDGVSLIEFLQNSPIFFVSLTFKLALLGWLFHLVFDLLRGDGIPLGVRPLRRHKVFMTADVSERTTARSWKIHASWQHFLEKPLELTAKILFISFIVGVLLKIGWNLPS